MSLCYTVRRAEATMFLLACVIGSTSLDDSSTANLQVRLCPTAPIQSCLFQSQLEMKNDTKTAGKDERKTLTGGVSLLFQVTSRTAPAVYILTRLAWRLWTRQSRKVASCSAPWLRSLCSLAYSVCEATPPSSIFRSQKHYEDTGIHDYELFRIGRAY